MQVHQKWLQVLAQKCFNYRVVTFHYCLTPTLPPSCQNLICSLNGDISWMRKRPFDAVGSSKSEIVRLHGCPQTNVCPLLTDSSKRMFTLEIKIISSSNSLWSVLKQMTLHLWYLILKSYYNWIATARSRISRKFCVYEERPDLENGHTQTRS